MNSIMVAFGIASVMLCVGMACRSKIRFLQKMLVPVSVIAGIFGFIFMNFILSSTKLDVSVKDFSTIVDVLFTFSFISIGLCDSGKKSNKGNANDEKKKASGELNGAMGMGIVWCILYALTAVVGVIVIAVTGKMVGMNPMYGILIPFAFCQGPGQASTYGRIFEQTYGFENAEMVALTFAVIGFLSAFFIGVPLAKYGLKKGLAKSKAKISKAVEKGYFTKEEQRESMGKVTTHSGNIDTLTIHFAIMGVAYLLALGLARLIYYVPLLGETFSEMLFFWGMIAAYIVKYVMKKLKMGHLINVQFQGRITGWTSDYLVACAFMAIHVTTIGNWIIPIIIESIICTVITFVVCIYFGSRFGSDHDFERVLGLYGTSTGTTPSGIALLRIVDPKLQTTTTTELGMMNMVMIFSTPTMILITLVGLNTISMPIALGGMILCIGFYMVLLKVFKVWRKPTFTLKKGLIGENEDEGKENGGVDTFVQGFIREEYSETAGLIK